jgi:DNA polymerase-1
VNIAGLPFREVWVVDFEFGSKPGECPEPICMVGKDLRSGRTIRLWQHELENSKSVPFSIGAEALLVAYYSVAELSCFISLGWPLPENVLDLYVEFRNFTNEKEIPSGRGLLGALAFYGLGGCDPGSKTEMRELALRGGPWSESERSALLEYCESDVISLERLLPKMLPEINLGQALLRGRYMRALAQIERIGIPLDTESLKCLYGNWEQIELRLIEEIDDGQGYHVYDGTVFRASKFAEFIREKEISWPLHQSGSLDLSDDTFKEMSKAHPILVPLRQLRRTLSQMRENKLEVGGDGRNRISFWAFSSKTGRNQPSTSKFIFGLSKWFRGFIRPAPGMALAYIDWSQQEFGIAAALSNDEEMMKAYFASDPYLAFAKQAGAAPADATKESHGDVRKQFKECALGVQYGIGEHGLAKKICRPPVFARELLQKHKETYSQFATWMQDVLAYAYLSGRLRTVFGWRIHVGQKTRANTLKNFPMQANGAEMMRLAACLATERGVRICAPIHDAFLIEAPEAEIMQAVRITQEAMAEASRELLGGFELRSDSDVYIYPSRYEDKDGAEMWRRIWELSEKVEGPVLQRAPHLLALVLLPVLFRYTCAIYSLSILGVI